MVADTRVKSDISFREAHDGDGASVRGVVFSVLEEYGIQPSPDTTDADLFGIDSFYWSRGGMFEVLVDSEGAVVGTFGLVPMSDGVAELRKMYLSPEFRGKGIGKLTLSRAIEKARAMGFSKLYLETATPLKEAIALYESFGFRPTDEVHASRCDRAYTLDLV